LVKFYRGLGEELSLYVRQLAWLNAVPDKETETRRDLLKSNIEMPSCATKYLIDCLFDIGPILATGTGNISINHLDIRAWVENTGIQLNVWECRTVRSLSIEYLHQINMSSSKNTPAPFGKDGTIIANKSMQKRIREMAK
jgi:hypothetical protein